MLNIEQLRKEAQNQEKWSTAADPATQARIIEMDKMSYVYFDKGLAAISDLRAQFKQLFKNKMRSLSKKDFMYYDNAFYDITSDIDEIPYIIDADHPDFDALNFAKSVVDAVDKVESIIIDCVERLKVLLEELKNH